MEEEIDAAPWNKGMGIYQGSDQVNNSKIQLINDLREKIVIPYQKPLKYTSQSDYFIIV